jgi:glutamyl-tRNA reductase
MPDLKDSDRQEIEYLTERIVNKILNQPTQVLKKEVSQGSGYKHIDAIKKLFNLK